MATGPLSFCPRCGTPRTESFAFCGKCGFAFDSAPQLATTVPAPQAPAPQPPEWGAAIPRSSWWSRQSRRTRLAIIVGSVVALLVIGSATGRRDETPPTAVRATPTATERVAALPTTSERVAAPTASPNTGALGFLLFAAHVGESGQAIAAGLNEVAADASSLDIDALTGSSIDLWIALGDEADWLDNNPPEACFASLHARYSEGIDMLYEALDLISDGAIFSDPDMLNQGATLMTEGSAIITEAAGLIESAGAACGA